jgi:hypothetical protein
MSGVMAGWKFGDLAWRPRDPRLNTSALRSDQARAQLRAALSLRANGKRSTQNGEKPLDKMPAPILLEGFPLRQIRAILSCRLSSARTRDDNSRSFCTRQLRSSRSRRSLPLPAIHTATGRDAPPVEAGLPHARSIDHQLTRMWSTSQSKPRRSVGRQVDVFTFATAPPPHRLSIGGLLAGERARKGKRQIKFREFDLILKMVHWPDGLEDRSFYRAPGHCCCERS